MRIFLIGFMGVGKSTLGRMAAEKLSMPFLDFDTVIEEDHGKSIADIFAEFGEPYFRKLEHDLLRELIQTRDRFIMGTGGGLPCFHKNIDTMNKFGMTIYLRATTDAIVQRLSTASGVRPLIANKNKEQLAEYVKETLQHRSKYYGQATDIFDVDLTLSKVENVDKLIEVITSGIRQDPTG